MTDAVGPTFTGGFEHFVVNDERNEEYTLLFLPDRNNDDLQREGKPAVFYYMPEQVRLARMGERKDIKFHHTHFVGVQDENSVGIEAGETQGGVLAFTTTSRFPTAVLAQAQQELIEKFSGRTERYWGIRGRVPPNFRIVPILSNITALSNITPNADGSVPQQPVLPGAGNSPAAGGGAGGGAPGGGGAPAAPAPNAGAPAGGAPGAAPGAGGFDTRGLPLYAASRGIYPYDAVPHGRGFRAPSAIEPWAWKMMGQGPGSVTGGENAYAGIMGPIPSEIIWAGFHGAYSPLVVVQNMIIPVWSQLLRIKITGNWQRIFDHFSAHANAHFLWFSADIKTEFNNLRINGDIKVEVDIDGTTPGAEQMNDAIEKRIDLIVKQFTDQAKTVIFDPPMPNVPPAEAPSGGIFSSLFGGGAGLALKQRHDSTQVNLSYEETRYFRYLQPNTISSSLQGFYDEIKRDPDAEKKYFTRLVLGGLGRKVFRITKPIVNWPDRSRGWVGQPVAFLSAQVGYPGDQGQVQWKATTFQATDPVETTWKPVFVEWRPGEVANPPQDWTPDKTYVKRRVHLLEPPGETESPNEKVFVEQNVIELDPGPNGSLSNDNVIEVRADSAGMLDVGPIALGVGLESNAQIVEVEFRAQGNDVNNNDRSKKSTRFRWVAADQDAPRYWRIFTGQSSFVPAYSYRVHVTVRGTLFNKGQAWSGPWVATSGNGALMVDVPGPTDPGVTTRDLTPREMASAGVVRAVDDAATGGDAAPPVALPPGAVGVPTAVAPSATAAPPSRGNGGSVAPPPAAPRPPRQPAAAPAMAAPASGMPDAAESGAGGSREFHAGPPAAGTRSRRDTGQNEPLVLYPDQSEPPAGFMPADSTRGVHPTTRKASNARTRLESDDSSFEER